MKRSIALAVSIALMCLLMAGCALFRTHRSGTSKNAGTAGAQAGASIRSDVPKSNPGSNQVAAQVAPATGAVGTSTSEGQATNVAGGGTGAGLGGTETGASTNEAGAGPSRLFYLFILLAGAIVGWFGGALWHNYHRHRRGEPPERYERPAA